MDLVVTVGSYDGPTLATATLIVTPDGEIRGTGSLEVPDAAAAAVDAVTAPAGHDRLIDGEAAGQVCTEIFGGPDIATVTGTLDGADVATSLHRDNGCGITDWTLLEPLLGRPRWDVDTRVVQRDEAGLDITSGEQFTIELASNDTSGYAWVATIDDESVVAGVDHTSIDPSGSDQVSPAVGAGGWERFAYRAAAAGTTQLRFEYRRSFEPDAAPADTATFEIRVADATPTTDATLAPTDTTGTSPGNTWQAMPDTAAGRALGQFISAARMLHDGALSLIDEAAQLPAGATVSPSVSLHARGAVDEFHWVLGQIPLGLDPVVRSAAVDVVFALGREIAPFLFAPGWEFDGWDAWANGVAEARRDLPATVVALADAAAAHADVATRPPSGIDAAAVRGGLQVLVVRGFGHANFDTQPPWSVRWLGGLPTGDTSTCFIDGRPHAQGEFTPGVGGCAVLYYDTADPSVHDAELTTWLADPGSVPPFRGEVITIRWRDGDWLGIGSAE